jgi:hypothetical protein
MQIEERLFSGSIFRPRPIINIDEDGGTLVISIPWGTKVSAETAAQSLRDHYLSARVDQEATMPFDRLTCLSSMANDLRIAVKVTNDAIYHQDNRDEYTSGIELFAMTTSAQELAIAQVGGPHAFYNKSGNNSIIPLSAYVDLSLEFSSKDQLAAPLPSELLGIENTSNFSVKSIRYQAGDQIILLSRSSVPARFLDVQSSQHQLDELARILANDDPSQAFWLGLVSF